MNDEPAPGPAFIERGVPVALGTDFNPGTSPTPNLPLVMTLACLELKLTPTEALAAVTINAAHALGARRRGRARSRPASRPTSSSGACRQPHQIPYWPGADLVRDGRQARRGVVDRRGAG